MRDQSKVRGPIRVPYGRFTRHIGPDGFGVMPEQDRRFECNICGMTPVGSGCYRLCPNSVHFYSPEQERADEPFYGMDDNSERYAATAEPSQYDDLPF